MTEPTASPDQPDDPQGADATAAEEERAWWDDPALPWRHKPTRTDIACLSALGVVAVYGMVMLPLQPVILGLAPHLLGSLGYRTGLIMTGALAAVGDTWWPLVWLIGSVMLIKFHWIYWWAGKLWGREIVDIFARDKGPRTQRIYNRVWSIAHRYETLALIVSFLPIPLPGGVIFAALGAAGMKLRKFLTVAIATSLVTSAGYLALGYALGAPAVTFMETYARYMWFVSLAIIAGMIGLAVWRTSKRAKAPTTAARPEPEA